MRVSWVAQWTILLMSVFVLILIALYVLSYGVSGGALFSALFPLLIIGSCVSQLRRLSRKLSGKSSSERDNTYDKIIGSGLKILGAVGFFISFAGLFTFSGISVLVLLGISVLIFWMGNSLSHKVEKESLSPVSPNLPANSETFSIYRILIAVVIVAGLMFFLFVLTAMGYFR